MSKRVYLDSVGCRLNQSEITNMERQFRALGYEIVQNSADADLAVLNTCAVTKDASKTSRNLIRNAHRSHPDAEITVTGCYAHIAADQIQQMPGVVRVIDNFQKEQLVQTVTGETFDLEPLQREFHHQIGSLTRAYVKVQDGCDNHCTFCVTKIARGASRSRPMEEILREVQWLEQGGYQEIVLTGVNLGAYGYDFGDLQGLYHLIEALLTVTAIPRIRLSSLEPWNLDEQFFSPWQNPRMCRHLHLPLQSGSDATLRRMLRRTSQHEFQALVEAARTQIPDLALSTDLIVGFPGETEAEFAESYAFTAAMEFMKVHVFPFSPREGTAAPRIRGQVPKEVIKERLQQIQELSDRGEQRYYKQHLDRTVSVLWENVRGASEAGFFYTGLTDNYIRVETTSRAMLTNRILPTRLLSLAGTTVQGQILSEGAA